MYNQDYKYSDYHFSESTRTYYDDDDRLYNSYLDHRTYLTDIKPAIYHKHDFELVPKVPIYDPNDPANVPYQAADQYEDDYKEYIMQYIRGLQKMTVNHEEIAFAKYLSECSIIDLRINLLQQLLRNDPRFNAKLLFDFFDSKKNTLIDFNEFQLGLQKLNIMLKQNECYQLFLRYGAQDDGQISAQEFKSILTGPEDSSKFIQFGAMKYMHHPLKQPIAQFLSVAQRDTIHEIIELQTQLERNLIFIREIIGEKDILLALFRQIDIGSKGYIILKDLILYLNELGGQFIEKDVAECFRRMSKINCSRVNFNEFQNEFMNKQRGQTAVKRERDYIQEYHNKQKQLEQQKLQEQKESLQTKQKESKLKEQQKSQPKQPYVQQNIHAANEKKQKPLQDEEDLDDLLFPGFEKYQLQQTDE